jgi:hypothetical protein
MSRKYPVTLYRRHSKKSLRQGDIALAEFHQLRSLSGSEPKGPGPRERATKLLPFLGDFDDYAINVTSADGKSHKRVLRLWQGFVLALHQNCELEFGDPEDSRLTVAPIVSREQWPEAEWDVLRENRQPGFFYLPATGPGETERLELAGEWPESVAVLASSTLSSVNLVKPRRVMSLTSEALPHLQDAMVRFGAVRGFNDLLALQALRGKRIVDVQETTQTVTGPSRLIKVYFGGNTEEVDDEDDEATVTYFGTRV